MTNDKLLEAAKWAVMEWRLHGQLTDSCRVLERAIAEAEQVTGADGGPQSQCTPEEFARQQAETDGLWAVHNHGLAMGKALTLEAIHGEHHAATLAECGHWRCQADALKSGADGGDPLPPPEPAK